MTELRPDTLLRRKVLAEALTAKGYPTTEKGLATKATRGGGPPFHKWGRFVLYPWGTSLAWAEARLSTARSSTAEHSVERARSLE